MKTEKTLEAEREAEATQFAMCLLMPSRWLKESAKRKGIPITARALNELADEYGVSVQAMVLRLSQLKIAIDPAG